MASEIPNFGALLAPVLSRVPDAARPRFLALLERTAADRYRVWAAQLPIEAEALTGCAQREDEIADRIEALFDIEESALAELRDLLPEARALYYAAFDGIPVIEQLRMQADAELQGANAWRSIARKLTDEATIAELNRCSEIEEASSAAVAEILERLAG
jgi:hypothetical protein